MKAAFITLLACAAASLWYPVETYLTGAAVVAGGLAGLATLLSVKAAAEQLFRLALGLIAAVLLIPMLRAGLVSIASDPRVITGAKTLALVTLGLVLLRGLAALISAFPKTQKKEVRQPRLRRRASIGNPAPLRRRHAQEEDDIGLFRRQR